MCTHRLTSHTPHTFSLTQTAAAEAAASPRSPSGKRAKNILSYGDRQVREAVMGCVDVDTDCVTCDV